MIWLAFPALIILAVRVVIVLVNFLSVPYLTPGSLKVPCLVSVLIPARNEEKKLPVLLEGVLQQDYPSLEILIYDDDSSDRTREVIEAYALKHKNIRTIRGGVLPEGWNGKNNACHQLAMSAVGCYFLYLDADVTVTPHLVTKAVSYMQEYDLTLLSLFPRQLMKSFGEYLTVPAMNWILLSLLPLRLIRGSHHASLAAANGQFMMFRAREYRQHHFHQLVKEINVEDIHVIRKVKKMGYLSQTLLSRGEISCRMYESYRDGVFGFTRSMFAFFGGSGITMFLFTLFSTFGPVFVWIGFSPQLALIYLLASVFLRTVISILSRQPLLLSLMTAPLFQVSFIWMVIQSFRMKWKGENSWKGRIIQFKGI